MPRAAAVLLLLGIFVSAREPDAGAAGFAWETNAGFRGALLPVPARGKEGFTLLSEAQTGIAFSNHLADVSAAENQIRLIGSGVALGDVDGDDWCDVFLARLEGGCRLYRNRGDGRFEDITERAGVGCPGQYSTGCALADLDGDGDADLLVNSIGGGTRLFLNEGRGRFAEQSGSGLQRRLCATTMTLADVDADGDLDLYVANYRTTTVRSTGLTILNVNGKRVLRPEDRDQYEFTKEGMLLEHGEPDSLYLNDGRARFSPVSWTGGAWLNEDGQPLASAPKDWGLSAMFHDLDGDGAPDLYVCNDFWSADRVWLNESRPGRVRFRAAPRLMLRQTSTFSMGVDFADLNRDGQDDFLVLDMLSRDHPRRMRQRSLMGAGAEDLSRIEDRPQTERNTLFLNRGDGTFAEIAQFAGLAASEWSWAVAFLDVDLDGFEDVLVTTGHGFDTQDADTEQRLAARGPAANEKLGARLLEFPPLRVANSAFRNRGDLTFEECAERWGFATVGVKHGLALADLDNDGDLDVVVNQLNGPALLYRNESPAPRVAVRLRGAAPNTHGVGAKLRFTGGPVAQSQEMIAGGRYLSSDAPARVFAGGAATNLFGLEVTWRGGGRTVLAGLKPNHLYEVNAATAITDAARPSTPELRPLFSDASDKLGHTHRDEPFDDFARQPLLPRRLSQLGPGVSWIDLDGDGREELLIGAGRGGAPGLFRNRGDGGFDAMRVGGVLSQLREDVTSIVGWANATGAVTLLFGQANYETGDTNLPAAHRFEIRGGMKAGEALPPLGGSPGPLAVADVDGDGDLDLFIGGRVKAGRYPEPCPSRLYRNDGGSFQLLHEWPDLGLVSGAVFSDLEGDGFAELIVACEWGPLKVFRFERGAFTRWNPPVTHHAARTTPPALLLSDLAGWWTSVTSGDFDHDGRMDLVAGNWGRNTAPQEFIEEGWRLHFGDLTGSGGVDLVESFQDRTRGRTVPWRDLDTLAQPFPWLREQFATSAAFGESSLAQVFGARLDRLREVRVNWLNTSVFLNRGDHFEVRALPWEAQLAPVFGLAVADFDGDGKEDLFLAQNFFGVDARSSRHDAGRGLLWRGDGRGGFAALTGAESGVLIYGEQRGAAAGDYDGDGRVDLAVAQHNAATKLLHNERAPPGMRVRLRGPAGNASGLGAVVRVLTATGASPAREIHGGGGYWSQESAVPVLARPATPARLVVRWPGGRVTTNTVPAGAAEVVADFGPNPEVK